MQEEELTAAQKFCGCVIIALFLVLVATIGFSCGIAWERRKAVEAGAGKWEANPSSGAVNFVYFPQQKPAN